jgi:class 3 adenylate cyclase
VLFCDLVGFTTLSERLDAEDLRDLLNAFQRVCRKVIEQHGGHISQFLGDGVMACFGFPAAHEDDAVRAARAALRILEGLGAVNAGIGRRLNAEVRARVGLHTGLAVVGEISPGAGHNWLAVGDTVNMAVGLQGLAGADKVVASAATARLIQGQVELQSKGHQMLQGFSTPMELFELLGEAGRSDDHLSSARQ